jgi:hypothetical protein
MAMNKLNVYLGPDGEYTFLPYHLPAGASGKVAVTRETKKKGDRVTIVSMRNALYMGLEPASVILDRDVVVHRLTEEETGTWMTTLPQELEQVTRQLDRAHGHVLVGGLGLGLAVSHLGQNPKVKSVVVIEKSGEVSELVWEYVQPKKCSFLVRDDLYSYLRRMQQKHITFDFAYYDVWQLTGQFAYQKYVLPLRRLSVGVVSQDQIECWNESEMLGQTLQSLETRIAIEYGELPFDKWKLSSLTDKQFAESRRGNLDTWPFLHWMRRSKPTLNEAREEVEYYLRALKDAELWKGGKWSYYERIRP